MFSQEEVTGGVVLHDASGVELHFVGERCFQIVEMVHRVSHARVAKSILPGDIESRYALLVHPTLSTGTSIRVAVEHLVHEKGVDQRQIIVLVLLSCPSSIEAMNAAFPGVRIVTAGLDQGLDPATGRIYPGIGSFGHRYAPGCKKPKDDDNDDGEQPLHALHGWPGRIGDSKRSLKMKRRKTRRALANKRKL